jgi:hypothetical protein
MEADESCSKNQNTKTVAHSFYNDGFGRDALPSMAHRPAAKNTIAMAMAYRGGIGRPQA